MKKVFFILFFIFLIPKLSYAKIIINEIAWMGSQNSANDEWIELKNTSSTTQDVTNWILKAEDGSPNIKLKGSIPPNGFFLLERSDDNSVLGVKADQIYSGALSNSGERLMLFDESGNLIDSVDGSDGWKNIGGDNSSKKTAQRDSNEGWFTADPTPKAENVKVERSDSQNQNNNNFKTQQQIQKTIKANAGKNIETQSGFEILFDGSNSEGNIKEYLWSFGNGDIKKGKKVYYAYKTPGRYLATLFVYGEDGVMDKSQIDVLVYPSEIYLSEIYFSKKDGFFEFYNNSGNVLDISGFILKNDKEDIIQLPLGSYILPKSYFLISNKYNFLNTSGTLEFLYPNKILKERISYDVNGKKNVSLVRVDKESFAYSNLPTPKMANILSVFNKGKKVNFLDGKDFGVSSSTSLNFQFKDAQQIKQSKIKNESLFFMPTLAKVRDEYKGSNITFNALNTTNNTKKSEWGFSFFKFFVILFSLLLIYFFAKKIAWIK